MKVVKPRRDAVERRVVAELAALAEALSGRCRDTTQCIYRLDQKGLPHAVGSCVLLALGDERFLISAAHVLDEREQYPLVVPTGSRLASLTGDFTRIFAQEARTNADDYVDVGVVRLPRDLHALIPADAYLRWRDLDHVRRGPTRDAFGVTGYPLTKQRNARKGYELTARAYELAAEECPVAVYASVRRDPAVSLMLGFEKRRVWGPDGVHEMPDLPGMSGCGVWHYGPSILTATTPPRLAGIAVEWHPKGRHPYILGTRISIVIAALTRLYPDVRKAVLTEMQQAAGREHVTQK